jgi:hypothetical protein
MAQSVSNPAAGDDTRPNDLRGIHGPEYRRGGYTARSFLGRAPADMADVGDDGRRVGMRLVGDMDYRDAPVVDESTSLIYAGYFASLHPVIFTLVGLVVACWFYLLREWCRVAYAAIGIFAGLCALYNSTPVTELGRFSQPFDQLHFGGFTNIQYLTIIGAIYLIVRGLDNLDKGLQTSQRWTILRAAFRIDRR